MYLFAFASIFVPSTKYSSVLIYPFFSSTTSNSTNTSSIMIFILSFLNELITFLVGLFPPANHMNFISHCTASAICLEEYLFRIYPYINIFNIIFGEYELLPNGEYVSNNLSIFILSIKSFNTNTISSLSINVFHSIGIINWFCS